MSVHDFTLIFLSVAAALFLLRNFGVIEVSLKGIFGFDLLKAPVLEHVLDADELRHFKEQEMGSPVRVKVRLYYYEAQFEVRCQRGGEEEVRKMEEVFATNYTPTVLWECDLPEKALEPPPFYRSVFDKSKIVIQYERNRNRIVFGTRGGRFNQFPTGYLDSEHLWSKNILAEIPLDASKLRPMCENLHLGEPENPMGFWSFIVKHEDDKILWFASCTDVSGLVNRRRFL
ncbi:MAG: hypothetical protein ACHQPI_10525 [Thermoanaerobaculia bacterium]